MAQRRNSSYHPYPALPFESAELIAGKGEGLGVSTSADDVLWRERSGFGRCGFVTLSPGDKISLTGI